MDMIPVKFSKILTSKLDCIIVSYGKRDMKQTSSQDMIKALQFFRCENHIIDQIIMLCEITVAQQLQQLDTMNFQFSSFPNVHSRL